MTSWQLYWITRLDDLNMMCGVICTLAFITSAAVGILGVIAWANDGDDTAKVWRWTKTFLLVAVVAMGLGSLIPTTKEMAAIIIVPRIANNEKVQDVGNRLYDLAVEWMSELAPKKAKQEGGVAQ